MSSQSVKRLSEFFMKEARAFENMVGLKDHPGGGDVVLEGFRKAANKPGTHDHRLLLSVVKKSGLKGRTGHKRPFSTKQIKEALDLAIEARKKKNTTRRKSPKKKNTTRRKSPKKKNTTRRKNSKKKNIMRNFMNLSY